MIHHYVIHPTLVYHKGPKESSKTDAWGLNQEDFPICFYIKAEKGSNMEGVGKLDLTCGPPFENSKSGLSNLSHLLAAHVSAKT